MTSTSSSSNDRMTDWAPVSCCGATFLGWLDWPWPPAFAADCAALASAKSPYAGFTGGCGGRVVGALTMSSFVLLCCGFSNHCWGNKKPPSARPLYEGCASILVTMPESGPARYQRATQLLRASPGSPQQTTVVSALVNRQ